MAITYRETGEVDFAQALALYRALRWSSAEKPRELERALRNSHSLVTAWDGSRLVGLGNAISDGALVVYYPHMLVLPEYQGRGIGREIVRRVRRARRAKRF
jgi:GNAT superfamily N-acetyltransferase